MGCIRKIQEFLFALDCSTRHISVVYENVMYLCSMLDREIETPKESVERDHS